MTHYHTRSPQWLALFILVLLFMKASSLAFVKNCCQRQLYSPGSSTVLHQAKSPRYDKEGRHIEMNVIQQQNHINDGMVDYDRAQYCAENFGVCSIEEIESIQHGTSHLLRLVLLLLFAHSVDLVHRTNVLHLTDQPSIKRHDSFS
jgi:hypothetical protein